MKKPLSISLAAIAILSAILLLVPNVLKIKALRNKVAENLRHELHGEVDIDAIAWHWFPTPHVAVQSLEINNDLLDAELPDVDIYPDWLSFFPGRRISVRSVELRKPDISLKKIGGNSQQEVSLPAIIVKIKDGTITTPALAVGKRNKIPALAFSSINAILNTTPESLAIKLRGSAPYLKEISMQGRLNLATLRYSAEIDCQGLVLSKGNILPADGNTMFSTSDAVLSLKSKISGEGTTRFNGNIVGDMPCLLYKTAGEKMPVNCGFGDISIKKDGRAFALVVNALEVREPNLSLSGIVSRTPQDGADDQWHIDLDAKKVDLTAIRSGVLNLLPNNEIAALVCDIVRSGEANSASFSFDGPLADLAHLRKMTIAADVKSAEIHIPHADLDIYDASGPILIKDGALTGQGLSAKYGDSVGKNGVLLVGLAHDHFGFELNLDIDARLADIATALKQQVHHQSFQDELARFSNPQGTASGHLTLGDHQHHIEVAVAVDKMNGSFLYDRIPWPVSVYGGELQVDTDDRVVKWQDIVAGLGQQRIKRANGSVHWDKGPVMLNINGLVAEIDSAELFKGLDAYPFLHKHFKPVLTAVSGPVSLKEGSLSGPLSDPAKWQYSLAINGKDIRWFSPLLPAEIDTRSASILWNEKELKLLGSDNLVNSHPMTAKATLQHHLLHSWSGIVDLQGQIGEETGRWIKENGWLPPSLLPHTPARLDKFRLVWGAKKLLLNGLLRTEGNDPERPAMEFDIKSRRENPLVLRLDFANGNEKGSLQLDLLDKKPETFTLQWHGTVRGATVNALMADKDLLTDSLQGDFRMTVPDPSTDSRFEGWLRADNFSWYWGTKTEFIKVGTMSLQGKGDELLVKKLDLDFGGGESLTTHGSVTPEVDGLMLDLNLTAPLFSVNKINDFLDDLSLLKDMQIDGCEGNVSDWSIIGTIDFNVDHFQSKGAGGRDGKQEKTLDWRPLVGRVELYPKKETRVEIDTASLCCLAINGVWNSPHTFEDSSFNLSTKCDPLPLFEDVLPCLGINQDVLEGSFTVTGEVHGEPKKWQSGGLLIHSDQGRILRMTLLSKIFSVVNLTDLFEENSLPDVDREGFPYSSLDLEAEVQENRLIINKAAIHGKGLNLFVRGGMDLTSFDCDFTVLIAPLKTLDAIISKIPLIGRVIGGENATFFTIPVKVTGPFSNPKVAPLAPAAIGEGLLNIVKDTLLLPFTILEPLFSDKQQPAEDGQATPLHENQ